MTISQILTAHTRNDRIRLLVQSRVGHWRLYRDAVILEIAERMPPVNGFYRRVAEEASAILGIPITTKIAYNVCNLTKSAHFRAPV